MNQALPQYSSENLHIAPQYALKLLEARFPRKDVENSASTIYQQLQASKRNIPPKLSTLDSRPFPLRLKRRSRVNLTKETIEEMNEIFRAYISLPESAKKRCTLKQIAGSIHIGYSTLRRKYKEFKVSSAISLGKKLIDPPKAYSKNRLACCIIEKILQQGIKFSNAREIVQFIEKKYGLLYTRQAINRAFRCLGKVIDNSALPMEKDRMQDLTMQQLMINLVKMQRAMLYFGKYHFKFEENKELVVLLLVSSDGAVMRAVEELQESVPTILLEMIKEYSDRYFLDSSSIWYLIISYDDLFQPQSDPILSRSHQNSFYLQMAFLNPKIIFINSHFKTFNPAYRLYEQITYRIITSQLSPQEVIALLPQWLSTQREKVCKIILEAELSFSSMGLLNRN